MASVYTTSTSPKTVLSDYQKLYSHFSKPKNIPTIIKLNLSWTKFYPAVSTPPWHFEATLKWLIDAGVSPKNIIPVENKTVVTKVKQGAKNHGWDRIAKKYNVRIHYLTDQTYSVYKPKAKMLILDQIFPNGILLPNIIRNKPLISLCTLKSHVFTTTTGSIKNYFGMLNTNRHHCHRFIHQAIIDLLAIQQELHPTIIAAMDGSVVGFGPGPRAMDFKPANLALASTDLVGLDATAAKIIGFNPQKIDYLTLGHRLGLGDINSKAVGPKKLPNLKVGFKIDTFASRGQKLIYGRFPLWLEKLLLQSIITPWSYFASNLYHDYYWYNFVGANRLKTYYRSDWGQLFKHYVNP